MDSKFHRKPNRLATASLFSKLFLFWVAPVLRTAYRKKTVEPHDLYACLPEDSTKEVGAQLSRNWNTQLGKTHPSLIYALTSTFGASFIFYGLGFLTEEVLRTFQPIFLKWLTEYFSPGSTVTRQQAYLYAGILGCSALFLALLHGPNLYVVQRMGMRVRVALCSLIYNHTLKLSYQSQGKTTAGKVHNLMTNDVNRFDQLFISLHYIWLGPLQAVIVLVLLFYEIGVASLPGYTVLLLIVPLNIWLGRIFTILRERTANFTDQRISIMTDIITAMRVIKMYAWEKPFGELVEKVRRSEIALIIEASYPISLNDTLGLFGSRLLDVGMIIFYTLTAPSIETARIFTVVSLCTTLRKSFLRMFPAGVQLLSECRVSLRRIEEYLTLEEKSTQPKCTSSLESPKENPHAAGKETQSADITVRHLTCSWRQREAIGTVTSGEESSHHLEDITFSVEAGTLLAVVGPVGVGKSSLLMAILGELPALRGEIQTSGRIAYVSQQPWVFGDTVRENIVFGRRFVEQKYHNIIQVCSLVQDLEQLPFGDRTIIGERGVTLSGGQKARINLARALYDDAHVYLLDDPLSAVDAEVSRQIYENCIQGYLADKPRILVTHQLQFLHDADQILVLREGRVEGLGKLEALQAAGIEFSTLMQRDDSNEEGDQSDEEDEYEHSEVTSALLDSGCGTKKTPTKDLPQSPTLFEDESTKQGDVSVSTYIQYFNAGGGPVRLSVLVLVFVGTQVFVLLSDYWLAYWASTEEARYRNTTTTGYKLLSRLNLTTEQSAGVYGGLIGGLIVVAIIRAFLSFRIMIDSSKQLHNTMFSSVVRSPIRFFDTTPTGRIQNRFTKDIGTMDDQLPNTSFDFFQMVMQMLGTVLITCVISYYTVVIVVPLFITLVFLTRYSLFTSTALKRLDGVSRSPVFSHTTSTLQGLGTIRAYDKEADFIHEFNVRQDHHTEAWFMYVVTSRWFAIRLDLLVFIFLSGVSLLCVPLADELDAGKVGLILTNCISLCGLFQYCVRQSAQLENQMTSVERVLEYTQLPPEPALLLNHNLPPPGWPTEGSIQFDGVSMSYAKDEPIVLKNITFQIQHKEKVGIVGRTGAGKSSLISALFRLTDISGNVVINDVDNAQIGLHAVRKNISIIPQVQLDSVIRLSTAKLDMEVGQAGSNFSVGQRQLICLARAILKKNRILVLDEATANVDPKTDALIQETIRTKFRDCTVLTVAHRLHTIIDSHRIMVLDGGQLAEFDTPTKLLENPDSLFSRLIEQTGKATALHLKAMANSSL